MRFHATARPRQRGSNASWSGASLPLYLEIHSPCTGPGGRHLKIFGAIVHHPCADFLFGTAQATLGASTAAMRSYGFWICWARRYAPKGILNTSAIRKFHIRLDVEDAVTVPV